MRALVNYAPGAYQVELREAGTPDLEPRDVLLKIGAVGVCGSDLHLWHGTAGFAVQYPVTLGHEFGGTVVAVGSEVQNVAVGDRVVCETAARICGVCAYCRGGHYNLCPHRLGYGARADGAMADYVRARETLLHRVPEGLPWEEAALTEPACVAYNACAVKSHPRPGDVTVVIGPGPIGLMSLQVLRNTGPAHLVIVGLRRDAARLKLALRLGATEVIVADEADAVARVAELGDGLGADLVIDSVGVSATLKQSLEMVRPNGQITKIGWGPAPVGFSLDALVAKAATLQGSFSHTWTTWERVLGMLARRDIDVRPLLRAYPLAAWEDAFKEMDSLAIAKAVLVP
ncbi:MAG: zinc-binding dehydrogenase [Chloroflexota bacterium]